MAAAFHAAGARVGILDIDAEAALVLATQLGTGAQALSADVADAAAMRAAIDEFRGAHECVDIFVNNAGVGLRPTPLEEVTQDDFERISRINMSSIFITSQLVVPLMKANGGGVILNIASTAGVSPRPGLTWYNASKGWVITATRSMAVELAAANIRVNAINPVAGETPLLSTFMGEDTPQMREKFLSTIPLRRFSTPEDIGAAAVYLCSDAASMVTGVALEVDGGRCV
ncbi:MAG: glucose 1-dehydrogenase [Pseudomonadota bacterium]